MTCHADRVREAEKAVVEADLALHKHEKNEPKCNTIETEIWLEKELELDFEQHRAVEVLARLRAETCPECGGTGLDKIIITYCGDGELRDEIPCKAGCDNGRRRT